MPKYNSEETEHRYVHPKTLKDDVAKRAARHMISKRQGFAMIPDGDRWKVVGPAEDESIILECIEEAKSP